MQRAPLRGGGALILLLWGAACLPAAPPPAVDAPPTPIEPLEPVYTQDALRTNDAPSVRGTVRGDCAGVVRLEARTNGQNRPLAATTAAAVATAAPPRADTTPEAGPPSGAGANPGAANAPRAATAAFVLYVPREAQLRLRWGCDADEDGVIAAAEVADAGIGVLTHDLPLDLRVQAPDAGRGSLVVVGPGDPTSPLLPPLDSFSPAGPLAPADGAIGPPLPAIPPAQP